MPEVLKSGQVLHQKDVRSGHNRGTRGTRSTRCRFRHKQKERKEQQTWEQQVRVKCYVCRGWKKRGNPKQSEYVEKTTEKIEKIGQHGNGEREMIVGNEEAEREQAIDSGKSGNTLETQSRVAKQNYGRSEAGEHQ